MLYIKETTLLLLIGWAGNEKHFLKLLSSHLRRGVPVGVVCEKGGNITISNIHESMNDAKIIDINQGFSSFMDIPSMLEDFLENYRG
jgi:hypothetical protein